MTETLLDPPPGPPPPPPRLARENDEKVVAGVCAGLARYTSTDPVLWRVAVAVLAVFGGTGFVLYALAWLLLPRVDQQESAAERLLRRPGAGLSAAGVVVLVLAAVVVLGISVDGGPGLGVLLVLGGVAYLVLRERRETPAPAYGPSPLATTSYGPSTWSDGGAPPPVARAPRERSVLGTLTLSLTVLVTGILLALRENGVESLTVARVLAVALLVVGAGLLVGTWWGRARWLAVVGLVLAGLLVPAALLEQSPGSLRSGLGERTWVPTDAARDRSFALGVGEAVLDLRQLPPGGARRVIDAAVGFGEIVVLVPEDRVVRVSAEVGLGEIAVRELDGTRTDLGDQDGTDVAEEFVVGSPGRDASVELDLEVGVGEIEVRRVTS